MPHEKKKVREITKKEREGRRHFWGLVPEDSSHGCSITEQAGRKWCRFWKKRTHISDGQETSSIRSPTLITRSLSLGGWPTLYCMWFFFESLFLGCFRCLFFVSFPFPRMRMERKFLTPSPFLTIVLMVEDQTEKNIIRPASRNRPRLHLASWCPSFV